MKELRFIYQQCDGRLMSKDLYCFKQEECTVQFEFVNDSPNCCEQNTLEGARGGMGEAKCKVTAVAQ